MATYYVIDKRSNRIVNAVTSGLAPEDVLLKFPNHEHLRLDANPPLSMLERYEYWNERP
jgi:hypothetical protein